MASFLVSGLLAEDVLHKVFAQSRLHEVVLQSGSLSFPVVPGLLHLTPNWLFLCFSDGQVLSYFVLQPIIVDFLCYLHGWAILAVVCKPCGFFFGLREDVIPPFIEVTLEEQM
jgi:hypothetical protein